MMRKLGILLFLLTMSCSSYQYFRKAEAAEKAGKYDRAVALYMEALARNPDNVRYKINLQRAKLLASQDHFEKAKKLHQSGQLQAAILEYQMTIQLDPNNQYAQVELEKAQKEWKEKTQNLTKLEELKEKAREATMPPKLNPKSQEPMSFSFPKPTEIKDILKAIGKAFGFNVIFDPQLREQKITLEVQDVLPEKALDHIMRSANTFYKVLDEHTIIVAPDTPQMRREYEDLMVQTFYLSNADVKDVSNILRSIVEAKRVAINDQLNAVVIRDSADVVQIARKIIDANDKARAEVLVDVELLQVDTQKVRNIGTQLGNYSYSLSLGSTTSEDSSNPGVSMSLDDVSKIKRGMWNIILPDIVYNFIKSSSEAELLAKPQLRITEGEKAQLHIGDRVPIVTATFQSYQTTGTAYIPYNSYQYTDVGIKIEIEPRVHHNREVTLKLKIEVSSAQLSADSTTPPIISTRTINSVIRLRDGETNFLAGLIRSDVTEAKAGFPWLQDIPVLGKLFSNTNKQTKRTDLVLTLTPHIIRMPDITEEDLLPIWIGTASKMSLGGKGSRVASPTRGPFDQERSTRGGRRRGVGRERPSRGMPFQKPSKGVQPIKGKNPLSPISREQQLPQFEIRHLPAKDPQRITVGIFGDVDPSKTMASLLITHTSNLHFQKAEPASGVEWVVNPVSEDTFRLDFLLPPSFQIDEPYMLLHFAASGEGDKRITIEKGGCQDGKGQLWPISATGITLP